MDREMWNLNCQRLQLDELWAFVGMKQKRPMLWQLQYIKSPFSSKQAQTGGSLLRLRKFGRQADARKLVASSRLAVRGPVRFSGATNFPLVYLQQW
jgi:hypothetical protein